MRKILGVIVLVVAFLAPTQIVLAADDFPEEHFEMTYQIMGRIEAAEMKLQEVKQMLMHPKKRMSSAKMKKMMTMLSRVEREIQQLIEIGDE